MEQGEAHIGRAHTALYAGRYLYAVHRARWMQQRLAWHLYRIKVFETYSHYTAYTAHTYYTCYSS